MLEQQQQHRYTQSNGELQRTGKAEKTEIRNEFYRHFSWHAMSSVLFIAMARDLPPKLMLC
jgi:hypothetical protein